MKRTNSPFYARRTFILTLLSFVAVAALVTFGVSARRARSEAARVNALRVANNKAASAPAGKALDQDPNSPQAAVIVATLTDNITAATKVAPGANINYTATITNNGAASPADDATNLNYSGPLDANTTLVAGSVHASPIAFNNTYNWIGNTVLDTSARALPTVTANDVAVNAPGGTDTFNVTTIAGGATTLGGTVTLAGSGHYTYTPPLNRPNLADGASVNDTFTYTISNSADPTLTSTGTVTITLTGRVFYLQAGAAGDGRSGTPSGNPATMSTNADKASDIFYMFSNAGSLSGLFTVDAGQQLLGQGINLVVNIPTLGSVTLFNAAAPTPTTTNGAGNCVTLSGAPGNNTLSGFNIGTCSALAIQGANVGTLAVSTLSINNTTGGGLDLTGVGSPTVNIVLGGLTATGGSTGATLNGMNGTITLASGALSGASGSEFAVNGGNATISYTGTITQNNAQRVVDVINTTGGSVTLSGTVTGGNLSTGVNINAANGNVTFTTLNLGLSGSRMTSQAVTITNGTGTYGLGTANIFTNTGQGLAATNADGTLNITTGTVDTTGAAAINIDGPGGLTTLGISLIKVNSTGSSTNGLALRDTNGSFTVAGNTAGLCGGQVTVNAVGTANGVTAPNTADCSGGTISGKSGDGVSLNNVVGISLTRMLIQNNLNSGIFADDTTNFSLISSFVDNNSDVANPLEANLRFNELLGTCAVTNCTITGAPDDEIRMTPASGTLTNLAISGTVIGNDLAGENGNGFTLSPTATANVTVNMTNSVVKDVFAAGIVVNGDGTVTRTFNVSNTSFLDMDGVGISMQGSFSADLNFNISNNTFLRNISNAVNISFGTTATNNLDVLGTIAGNAIGDATVDSGSRDLIGIAMESQGDADTVIFVNNNTIRHSDQQGFFAQSRLDNDADAELGRFDLILRDNTISNIDDNTAFPFFFVHGATIDSRNTSTLCFDSASNTSTGVGGAEHFMLRNRDTSFFVLERFSDGDGTPNETITNTSLVQTFHSGQSDAGSSTLATLTGTFRGFNEAVDNTCRNIPTAGPGLRPDEISLPDLSIPVELQKDEFDAGYVRIVGLEYSRTGPPKWNIMRPRQDISSVETQPTSPSAIPANLTAVTVPEKATEVVPVAPAPTIVAEVKQVVPSANNSSVVGKATPKASAAEAARIYRSERPLSHHAVFRNKSAFSQDPNAPTSGETVSLNAIATFPAGKSITIKYSATVNAPPFARQVSTQGTVTANGGAISVLTDDPEPGGGADPTVTLVDTLMTWNGVSSTDWNTATNWTQPAGGTQYAPGVSNPAVNDVVIPNVGNQPNINATDITIYSLNLSNGRTLSITSPRILTIGGSPGGDLTIDGIITGGFLNLGTGTHVINNAGGTGSIVGGNQATVLSGSTVTLANNLQMGSLTVNAGGNMTILNRTLSLARAGAALNIPGGATFTTTGSTVVLNGGVGQTIAGIAYNNLTINNSIGLNVTGVTLQGNATINGALALTSSDLSTGAFTLTHPNTTLTTGVSDVIGTVTRSSVVAATPLTFGHPDNRITITVPGTLPTSLTMVIAKAAPATYATAVARNYQVTNLGGSGFTATLRLHYLDAELNGNAESPTVNFNLRKGPGWGAVVPTARDTAGASNWMENNAVTSFSQWTFSFLAPTASGGAVTGRIVDDNGVPVEGAVVRLSGAQNRKFITDANGFYRFDNVETNGFYNVTPSRVNYTFSPAVISFSQIGETTNATFGASATGASVNPLDTPEYFVRQHYLDFLSREPDEAGFNFWSDQIIGCGDDADCVDRRMQNVSAAYFLSIEFQETGGLVDGLYRASYGRRPSYGEFKPDAAAVAPGLVVGNDGWLGALESGKAAFVNAFVQRPAFQTLYGNLSNDAYVDALIANTGVSFTSAERSELVSGLNGGMTRAAVLRAIVENGQFVAAKRNEAFVMMEYFGYLRREPDADGYQFWLHKLNEFNGNFEQAEMVKSFIISGEYRARFPR